MLADFEEVLRGGGVESWRAQQRDQQARRSTTDSTGGWSRARFHVPCAPTAARTRLVSGAASVYAVPRIVRWEQLGSGRGAAVGFGGGANGGAVQDRTVVNATGGISNYGARFSHRGKTLRRRDRVRAFVKLGSPKVAAHYVKGPMAAGRAMPSHGGFWGSCRLGFGRA
ncbi:hypothetical protein PMIN04_009910 [Paraphaeosphaeria minitans]